MARPRGTGKPPDLKYRGWQVRLPPDLLERFRQAVPPGKRAEFVRELLEDALQHRSKEGREMAVEPVHVLPGAIVRDPERCGGKPTLSGTRTGVHDVVSYARLYEGDLERVREEALPHLTIEQLQIAMDWYQDHQPEIDEILWRRKERYERGLAKARAGR